VLGSSLAAILPPLRTGLPPLCAARAPRWNFFCDDCWQ